MKREYISILLLNHIHVLHKSPRAETALPIRASARHISKEDNATATRSLTHNETLQFSLRKCMHQLDCNTDASTTHTNSKRTRSIHKLSTGLDGQGLAVSGLVLILAAPGRPKLRPDTHYFAAECKSQHELAHCKSAAFLRQLSTASSGSYITRTTHQ